MALLILVTVPGWQQEITEIRRMNRLPDRAKRYLARISELVGRPVEIASVGPERKQTIFAGR